MSSYMDVLFVNPVSNREVRTVYMMGEEIICEAATKVSLSINTDVHVDPISGREHLQ